MTTRREQIELLRRTLMQTEAQLQSLTGAPSDAGELAAGPLEELAAQRAWLLAAQYVPGLGLWETDLATFSVTWSPEMHRIFGTEAASFEATHARFLERVHPQDRAAVDQAFLASIENQAPCSIVHRVNMLAGAVKFVEERWQVWGGGTDGPRCLIGTCQDITERKVAEESLRASQALLGFAGRVARMGGWMVDLPSRELTWSDEVCALHDLPPGYRPTLDEGLSYFAPEHRAVITLHMQRCEHDGVPYDLELSKRSAKGRPFWVRTIGEAVRDPSGQIVRIQGAIQDITARKEAARELSQQAALLDQATDAIFVRDLEHRITYWNRSAERLYGWSATEAQGQRVDRLLHTHEAQAAFPAAMERLLATGEWSGELQKQTRAGALLTVHARSTLLRDEQGQPIAVLTINTDITEKKKLEAQFFRAQRIESIGTLAGGIAHDLNNVLTPIMLSVEVLKDAVRDDEGREVLDTLMTSAERGSEMVRQVLTFARGTGGKRVPVSLMQVLEEVERIMRDTLPKNVTCSLRRAAQPAASVSGAAEPWQLLGDVTQLHQVFMNLCVNARDAMPSGGKLTLSMDTVVLDQTCATLSPDARAVRYARVMVSDTGQGISPEVQERIFEPFFTTKELGKGTGLGLSTTQAIVKSHGGFLTVVSPAGQGATFGVYLPANLGTSAVEAPRKHDRPRGTGELLLVVDDEPAIHVVTKRTLERNGYRVLQALDGIAAVETFRRHADIAVVLTDMAMPGMDGPGLVVALKAIDPHVRIIGASGFPSPHMLEGLDRFLAKPYTAEALLQALHDVIALRPERGNDLRITGNG